MLKVAAVVILFHPDENVLDSIKSYITDIDILYVVCNSPLSKTLLHELQKLKKIQMIHQGINIGIAKAYNLALDSATLSGYTWLLTMDQDSSFPESTFKPYLKACKKTQKDKVIIFTPLHNPKFIQSKTTFQEKEYVMSSGNLIHIPSAQSIGGFDENLFIDEVDHEFCFRAKKNNYTILQDNTRALKHHLGVSHTYFPQVKLYPPIRLYYMTRNYLYLKDKYYRLQPTFFKQRNYYLLKFISKQLIYGNKRWLKIKMIYLGISDYRKKKFGKYSDR